MRSVKNKTSGLIKVCEEFKHKYPNKDLTYYKILIAREVLGQIVSREWINQVMFSQNENIEKKYLDNFEFFRSDKIGYVWQNRIYFLAERMYNLREIKNFNLIVKEILHGNLVSRFAEIEIGAHLLRRGINFEFVKPIGKKKQDFDIRIKEGLIVNCEVKHKLESTEFSTNTLQKTIKKANYQLPKDVPGLIFIKVPQEWNLVIGLQRAIDRVFDSFFKRHKGHILGIVFRLEQQNSQYKNLFEFLFKIERNPYYQLNKEEDLLLKKIEGPFDKLHWVSLEEIINKHML